MSVLTRLLATTLFVATAASCAPAVQETSSTPEPTTARASEAELRETRQAIEGLSEQIRQLSSRIDALEQQLAQAPPPTRAQDSRPQRSAAADVRTGYAIQLPAYADVARSRQMAEQIHRDGNAVWICPMRVSGGAYYRVQVGGLRTEAEARSVAERIRTRFGTETYVAPAATLENTGCVEFTGQ